MVVACASAILYAQHHNFIKQKEQVGLYLTTFQILFFKHYIIAMLQHPSDIVKAALTNLETDEKTMLDQATDMMQVHDGAMYEFDFLVCAAINRSVALSAGFRTLIRDQNFICAGPLLRLQLDTAFRVFAGFIVDKPHEFATAVLEGKHIRNMKDRNGQRMTDHYLVTQLVKEYPWIELVYENTSGYVHLSDKHFFNTFDYADRENRSGPILKIGSGDIDFPDEIYLEAISAFRASTQILMRYINGWIFTKGNYIQKGRGKLWLNPK